MEMVLSKPPNGFERCIRKKSTMQEPVSIKIEDDDDCETNNAPSGVNNEKTSEVNKNYSDIALQTENTEIVVALKHLIKDRMKQYEETVCTKINSTVIQLQRDNMELRRHLSALRGKLEYYEKKAEKRCSDTAISLPQKKKTPKPQTIQNNSTLYTSRKPEETSIFCQLPQSNQLITAARLMKPTPTSTGSRDYQPLQQVLNHRYGPSIQMITPVQQIINCQPRQTYPINEQHSFILLDSSNQVIGGNIPGVNTQVVASNQGLRMASLQPEVQRMHRLSINQQPLITTHQNVIAPYRQLINIQKLPNVTQLPVAPVNHQRSPDPRNSYNQIPVINRNNIHQTTTPQSQLPKLKVSISASGNGIILTWDCESPEKKPYRKVECYHLFAFQDKDNRMQAPTDIKQYKKIGVVNALPLPMACTLTQFATGNIYFFAVLAVDIHGREGEISNPCIIRLNLDS